jgi:hypothetical protein
MIDGCHGQRSQSIGFGGYQGDEVEARYNASQSSSTRHIAHISADYIPQNGIPPEHNHSFIAQFG